MKPMAFDPTYIAGSNHYGANLGNQRSTAKYLIYLIFYINFDYSNY
jgi:hypothetical protein